MSTIIALVKIILFLFIHTVSLALVSWIVVRSAVWLYFLYWIVIFLCLQIIAECLTYENAKEVLGSIKVWIMPQDFIWPLWEGCTVGGKGGGSQTGYKDAVVRDENNFGKRGIAVKRAGSGQKQSVCQMWS